MTNQSNTRKKIAVYTAIFGEYDDLKTHKNSFLKEQADFICFTDNSHLKSEFYEIVPLQRIHKDPVRNARYCKLMSHKLLPEYEYVIWVDANLIIVTDNINLFIDKYLNDSHIAAYHHDLYDCLYKESEWIISDRQWNADDPKIVIKQLERYREEKFPTNNGLINSNIIFRRNLAKEIHQLNELWWHEVKNGSRRDQLSFNYARWKLGVKISYIEGLWYDNSFAFRLEHKKTSYPPYSDLNRISRYAELLFPKKLVSKLYNKIKIYLKNKMKIFRK